MTSMEFCSRCDNLLYPKQDTEDNSLVYFCRHCNHEEKAEKRWIYKYEIPHSVGNATAVSQDPTSDPTLPRTKSVRCARCNHREAVFFLETATGETSMTLFFVCCNPNCGHRWRD